MKSKHGKKLICAILCLVLTIALFPAELALAADLSEIRNHPEWTEEQVDEQIRAVINDPTFTVALKSQLLSGASSAHKNRSAAGGTFTNAALINLGIASLTLSDGPAGVNIGSSGYKSTAWASPTALASTWNVDAMRQVGVRTGVEAVFWNVDYLLAPAHDLLRNPLSGRNFEYYSEDPTLSGKMASAFTKGIQSEGIGVTLKHFAANEQESYQNGGASNDTTGTNTSSNTGGGNAIISERALREIYLKSFEIPVREADPWGVMASYVTINGIQAHTNKWLLTDVLRGDWGFKGFVTSDWSAVQSPQYSALAQLDLMMPSATYSGITTAVNNNINGVDATYPGLTLDVLNRNVFNILKAVTRSKRFNLAYGALDTSSITVATVHNNFFGSAMATESNAVARKTAEESIILLKNDDNTLPLNPATDKISVVSSPHLRYYAGWGTSITSTSDFVIRGAGSSGVYVGDSVVANYQYTNAANPNKIYSFEKVLSDRGLLVGSVQDIYQAAGRTKTVSYTASGTGSSQRHTNETRGYTALPAATVWPVNLGNAANTMAASAAKAGVMIISRQTGEGYDNVPMKTDVATTYDTGTSGTANSMTLSKAYYLSDVEEEAVKAYANALHEAGKKFIVLLNVGSAIDTTFIDRYADAILVVWYPGQEGGNVMTDILYGAVNPSGKTTQTFLKSFVDSPSVAAARALPTRSMTSVYAKATINDVKVPTSPIFTNAGWGTNPVFYDEGVLVGYRWFDTKFTTEEEYNKHVAYPFGHGLSYTSFEFSDLRLSKPLFNLANGEAEEITATVNVKNTGTMAGKEVVQMYLGMINYSSEGRPLKDLRAFDKVELAPGEDKDVTFSIKLSDLQYFNDMQPSGKVLTGAYAGYSSSATATGKADSSNVVYGVPGSGWKVTPGSEFNVIIGDTSYNWDLMENGVHKSFVVDYPPLLDVKLSAGTLAEAAGKALSAKVFFAADEASAIDYTVIAALYDNGKLRGISSGDLTVVSGAEKAVTVSIDIPNSINGITYKLFLWDRTTFIPICAPFELR